METTPSVMTTLSQVMEKLRVRNQDKEFTLDKNGFTTDNLTHYQPNELKVIKAYRFEGASDPADSVVLYLLEATNGLIGYSIDSYGAYSNHEVEYDEFIRKIPVEDREESLIFNS